jgi:trk system potassium uptake protein TrkH
MLEVLGWLLVFLGSALLLPIPVSWYYEDGQIVAFATAAALTLVAGGILTRSYRRREDIGLREAFAIVAFTWIAFGVFGGLPYLLSGTLPHPIDAFFETMSGFTTTGASVLRSVEDVPRSLLFWRAFTQWLGGMGIIALGIAILPLLGVGGMQLFDAEAPGLDSDRLTPRIQDTARLLWGLYVLLTAAGILLLWIGDMNLFEAVCHTFTAVATGGFSTRNAGLAAFGSYSQIVTMILMLLGGINFALHLLAIRGQLTAYWSSSELRCYLGIMATMIALVVSCNWAQYSDPLLNVRDAAFNVITILTTTGFSGADYERWPAFTQALLLASMFIGGCAGSTSGGLKQVRLVLLIKHAFLQLGRLVHPRQVRVVKLDHRTVSDEIIRDVLGFTVLFLGVFVIGSLLLTAAGEDLITASSAVISCLSSIGPGLGEVGPQDNYASLSWLSKIILSLCMLLGRLEISTVLVMLLPSFWKR